MADVANWEVASIDTDGDITANGLATENVSITSVGVVAFDVTCSNELVASGEVSFTDLPTSDPAVAGQLWSNSGVVTVSAG